MSAREEAERVRDAIDHVEGAMDFQDAINPEALRVLIAAALSAPETQNREVSDEEVTVALVAHEISQRDDEPARRTWMRAALVAARTVTNGEGR